MYYYQFYNFDAKIIIILQTPCQSCKIILAVSKIMLNFVRKNKTL